MLQPQTLLAAALVFVASAHAVDFKTQVFPILNNKCAKCHSAARGETKGKFAIDRPDDMKKQVKAGSPEASSIIQSITLPDDDDDVMPPKGKGTRVSPAEVTLIKQWIKEGASFDGKPATPAPSPAAATTPAAGGAMKWTNAAGKSLQAEFDRLEADAVVLKAADGKYYKVPLASLSPESQAQARKAGGQ